MEQAIRFKQKVTKLWLLMGIKVTKLRRKVTNLV